MPETTTSSTRAAAAPPIAICDAPGCGKPATHTYTWDWGQTGYCCAQHQQHQNGLQANLKRRVTFTALASAIAPALTRPERTQLISERLAAEAELDEVKTRGIEIYNQNTELTRQVQSLRLRSEEREAQLRDANGKALELEEKLVSREAELAEAVQEVQRLRALIPREPAPKKTAADKDK